MNSSSEKLLRLLSLNAGLIDSRIILVWLISTSSQLSPLKHRSSKVIGLDPNSHQHCFAPTKPGDRTHPGDGQQRSALPNGLQAKGNLLLCSQEAWSSHLSLSPCFRFPSASDVRKVTQVRLSSFWEAKQCEGKGTNSGVRPSEFWVLALPCTSFVILGNFLRHYESHNISCLK